VVLNQVVSELRLHLLNQARHRYRGETGRS
jgi:hypothetical protein